MSTGSGRTDFSKVIGHQSSVIGPAQEGCAFNALTVDVEDYFQVTAFENHVRRDQWHQYPLRVVDNTHRVLDLFDRFDVKGTFFILGWVAERCPGLAPEILRRGHEIASHGYGHELVYRVGPERFREDVRRAKRLLEDQTGVAIEGYRAPSYSITGNSLWALDILVEEGYTFDSSIFPVVHDIYGIPGAERFPHVISTAAGPLKEFPISTYPLRVAGKRMHLPVAGGGYLRLFPAEVIRKAFHHINRNERQPAVLYFHPWEIDPGQPRIKATLKSRFRHYVNLSEMEKKISHMIDNLTFCPMSRLLVT